MGWRVWCLGIGVLLVLAALIMFLVLENKDDNSETNRIIEGFLFVTGIILLFVSIGA